MPPSDPGGFERQDEAPTKFSPDQLREWTSQRSVADYLLIDVRQPQEYEQQHLPGAHLLPLPELEHRLDELARMPEPNKIFYCLTGRRSQRAAEQALEAGLQGIGNLDGGIRAWRGEKSFAFPNLAVLSPEVEPDQLLLQAMNLEKGAERMYAALAARFAEGPLAPVITMLGEVEVSHARLLHGQRCALGVTTAGEFDSVYESLPGDLLESGLSLEEVVGMAQAMPRQGVTELLELALEIEFKAYDLYRALVSRPGDRELRGILLVLAEMEKDHAHTLMMALGRVS